MNISKSNFVKTSDKQGFITKYPSNLEIHIYDGPLSLEEAIKQKAFTSIIKKEDIIEVNGISTETVIVEKTTYQSKTILIPNGVLAKIGTSGWDLLSQDGTPIATSLKSGLSIANYIKSHNLNLLNSELVPNYNLFSKKDNGSKFFTQNIENKDLFTFN